MKKQIIAGMAAAMICVGAIGGTFAYLTSGPQTVTNTFTVGNVAITLDEAQVDSMGNEVTPSARGDKNTYKLIPGHNYKKDPTIHITKGSENCYVYVHVTNGIADLELDNDDTKTIEEQMTDYEWIQLKDSTGNDLTGYYYKSAAVGAGTDVIVFDEFTIDGDADLTNVDTTNTSIVVKACAIQADGFNSAQEAYNAVGSISGF